MRVKIGAATIALLFIAFCGCQKISIYRTDESYHEKMESTASYKEPDVTLHINRMRAISSDIYRDVLIADWASAKNKCVGVQDLFNMHKEKLLQKGVSDNILNTIEASFNGLLKMIEEKKSFEARTIANNTSKTFSDILYSFVPTIRTEFYNMGYFLRELTLHIEKKDKTAISEAFTNELEIWSKVREKLLPVYESDVIQVDEYFELLGKSLEKKDVVISKSIILNLISYLELLEMYLTNLQV